MQIHRPQLTVSDGVFSDEAEHIVQLRHPLAHKLFNWMVSRVAFRVLDNLTNNFSFKFRPIASFANCLGSYWVAHVTTISVWSHFVKKYLFVLILLLLTLKILTNLLVYWTRVHNHDQIIRSTLTRLLIPLALRIAKR